MVIKSLLRNFYDNHPLAFVMLLAISMRLIAAIFSEGYAFHDDHFDVTRVAHSWAHGIPHWLESGIPPKHSMLYAGLNAGLIWIAETIGLEDPYGKTLLMRLVHALYSCLIVWLAFKITLLLSDQKRARIVGLILAVLWFMPFMSIRFLVEMVCIPPVLGGFYLLIKHYKLGQKSLHPWIISGLLFGLAFAFRYHTILFAGGLGIVLLYRKQWIGSILFTFGYLLTAFLTVGMIDLIFFDYPFHSIVEYFAHNSSNAGKYITGSPLKFTLTTFGFIFPPVSIFLMIGYVKSYKIEPMMFVAFLIFFVFHSAFPNQQERFIFPMFPLLIILGVMGWQNIVEKSVFWKRYPNLLQGLWGFYWIMNIAVGLFMAFTFSKKDRVEPLHYLSKMKDLNALVIENEKSVKQPPVYYLGENVSDYNEWNKGILGLDSLTKYHPKHKVVFTSYPDKSTELLREEISYAGKEPNYILFQGVENIEKRKRRLSSIIAGRELHLLETVRPSLLDRMLHYFNPRHHRDQTVSIYRID